MRAEKIYLAARYSRIEEMKVVSAGLEAKGITVTSRWVNGSHQISDEQLLSDAERRQLGDRFATEDLEDVEKADVLMFFSEEPRSSSSRGGRHVEFGYALALGKEVVVVGPPENVFHCWHEVKVVPTVTEALDYLGIR